MKKRICHISTLHPRYDVRIFHKQCKSLTKNYDVHFIVADGQGDEVKDGINIHDVGLRQKSRLKRARIDSKKAYNCALEVDAELYHFHDPELSNIAFKLKKKGKIIVFDSHEDLPGQMLSKPYFNPFIRLLFKHFISFYEKIYYPKYNYIISATSSIGNKFAKINKHTDVVNNYPILNEFSSHITIQEKTVSNICFVGEISRIRGLKEVVLALELNKNTQLNLVGKFSENSFKEELESLAGWKHIIDHGYMAREKLAHIMQQSIAGIVTFLPFPNHINSQPNKMFEYMEAGLPLITSNFPLWKEIVEKNQCGLCVDPQNPKEISDAIDFLIAHPEEAIKMGKNGQKAIKEKYNWKNEEGKLLSIYKSIFE